MIGILSFIVALGIIILVHELGHFIVAKRVGILCHEFSIGMGPAIWSTKKGETTYSIRAIPLGGYVAMAGEEAEKEMVKVDQIVGLSLTEKGLVDKIYLDPKQANHLIVGAIKSVDLYKELTICIEAEDGQWKQFNVEHDALYMLEKGTQQIAPYDRCLESKSKFARFATMAAGATMNFILALVVFFIVGVMVGEPMYSNTLGSIVEGSPAQSAGLEAKDSIIEYNGQPVSDWESLTTAIKSTTTTTSLTYVRDGQSYTIEISPVVKEQNGEQVPTLGIAPDSESVVYQRSLLYPFEYSVMKTKDAFMSIIDTFRMLFVTKEAGVQDLSGPIGIYSMTAQIVTYGFTSFLIWVGFLSVNIGIMNLLPIPALDGGRILFVLIEAIIGRPIDRKIEGYIHMTGLLLFFGLFIYVTFNDVIRLFAA